MSSYAKWYRPHCLSVPDYLHEPFFRRPQPIIRGKNGTPVAARLVIPPDIDAISGALVEYAAVIAVNPRPDPEL
ncbi:hypothetical protein B0H65DRAFT_427063 [Neurospora tetraspora]|uniref:Uncharacterized protein n=1 Tax=Neurospora tetraspora TaxID=94610 RepID=A0AAE0JED5_9PEZI|nr:hypothetical protein B0H65DRAFT_427063 [Neurospora tetraspora]